MTSRSSCAARFGCDLGQAPTMPLELFVARRDDHRLLALAYNEVVLLGLRDALATARRAYDADD